MGSLAIDQKSVVLEEEIVGGGLEVREDTEGLIVLKSLRGGPAADAGVQPGDVILSIDGRNIRGMKIVSSMDLMKGSSGSQVKIRIDRKGGSELEFVLTRRIVRVWAVGGLLQDVLVGTNASVRPQLAYEPLTH